MRAFPGLSLNDIDQLSNWEVEVLNVGIDLDNEESKQNQIGFKW